MRISVKIMVEIEEDSANWVEDGEPVSSPEAFLEMVQTVYEDGTMDIGEILANADPVKIDVTLIPE